MEGLSIYLGNPAYQLLYQLPPNSIPPLVLPISLQEYSTIDRLALQLLGQCKIIEFCELEIFGGKIVFIFGKYKMENGSMLLAPQMRHILASLDSVVSAVVFSVQMLLRVYKKSTDKKHSENADSPALITLKVCRIRTEKYCS